MKETYKHSDITELIIKGFFNVYNELKFGFLEKVYERSLVIELNSLGLHCIAQHPIDVYYKKENVGFYIGDLIVNDCVIIEVKCAECICEAHEAQLTNYLRATNIEVGMLLNFGKKPEFKRKIFLEEYKNKFRS